MNEINLIKHAELIAYLDRVNPRPLPTALDSMESIQRQAGKRELIEQLIHELKNQEEKQYVPGR